MTYIEACRVAEEAANWIRKHDVERVKRVADLEKARGIIAGALNTDPITIEPEAAAPFVHPDDEPAPTPDDAPFTSYAMPNGSVQ